MLATPQPLPPTRAAALERLEQFLPSAGRDYARLRNYDHGPARRDNVSMLSPYVRLRLIGEDEIAAAVLARHSLASAEKFIQEVCWRTYWKGWLEQHPAVWDAYLDRLASDRAYITDDDDSNDVLVRAEAGRTGIDCFDTWAHELVETGYLHNHARMWFASIWNFTLRLPWSLGADFFYRHLLDGDPASNTLSWRWVAGLHTRGKTYLARADNIRTYTDGRFDPTGDLAPYAPPVDDDDDPPARRPLYPAAPLPREGAVALLVTDDDLSPETWGIGTLPVRHVAVLIDTGTDAALSPLVRNFRAGAREDALIRARDHFGCPVRPLATHDVEAWGRELAALSIHVVVGMRPPVGPLAAPWQDAVEALADRGVRLHATRRPWDAEFWPHARAGFFKLKDRIPEALARLGAAGGLDHGEPKRSRG